MDVSIYAMIGAGLNIDADEARKIMFGLYDEYGYEYNQIFQRFLEKSARNIDYHILAAGIIAYRKAQAGIQEPYVQVFPTLIKLRERGLKLAILSDAPKLKAWLRLVEMKIDSFFDVVVTFDDTGKTKPNVEPFKKVLEKLNLKAEECIMVGDWPERDLTGAKNIGMKTVFAKYGYTWGKPTEVASDYTIDSIAELVEIVS